MSHSPSRVILEYLADEGLVSKTQTVDWAATVNFLPQETPDNRVVIFDSFARTDGGFVRTGQSTMFPGIQIRVRGKTDEVTYSKIKEIFDALDVVSQETVIIGASSYLLKSFDTKNPPIFLQSEEKNLRKHWIFNGNVTLEEM